MSQAELIKRTETQDRQRPFVSIDLNNYDPHARPQPIRPNQAIYWIVGAFEFRITLIGAPRYAQNAFVIPSEVMTRSRVTCDGNALTGRSSMSVSVNDYLLIQQRHVSIPVEENSVLSRFFASRGPKIRTVNRLIIRADLGQTNAELVKAWHEIEARNKPKRKPIIRFHR